jgi:hypothetical protein
MRMPEERWMASRNSLMDPTGKKEEGEVMAG